MEKGKSSAESELVAALKGIQVILESLVIVIVLNFEYDRSKNELYFIIAGLILIMYLFLTIKRR